MDNRIEVVDVSLPNGLLVGVEVVSERGAGDVSALDALQAISGTYKTGSTPWAWREESTTDAQSP